MAGTGDLLSHTRLWWRHAVTYQVYLRSFADSDGDGSGDLAGLAQRLDYVAGLGADAIWLNPFYASPQRDGGYDISDYFAIDRLYGVSADFDELLGNAHARGLKVLMDIVPNHCSDQHPWFQAALVDVPAGAARSRFLFRDGKGSGGSLPPNNWVSVFGGPAWTRITEPDGRPGQWYLHSFDPSQPDFDWRNPAVGDYFHEILRFWFDRGVDGFRIDVASMLIKRADLPELAPEELVSGNPYNANQPEVHEIFRSWRALADGYGRDLVLVGEIWAATPEQVAGYVRPDELNQAFFFDLLAQPWDGPAFRRTAAAGLDAAESNHGTFAWTLNNHDVHRAVSRYGILQAEGTLSSDPMSSSLRPRGPVDVALGTRRARAAALFLLGLPGAVYLYQGEELGLPEVMDLPEGSRRDPIWERSGHREYGRDGCRIPLPWLRDAPAFGFSPTDVPGWLPQPAWFADYAVDTQVGDPASTLELYRSLIGLRRRLMVDDEPNVAWQDTGREDVIAYRRGNVTVVVVFGDEPFRPSPEWGRAVLSSSPDSDLGPIAGSSAVWLLGADQPV
jgi:alpha-glucosidase